MAKAKAAPAKKVKATATTEKKVKATTVKKTTTTPVEKITLSPAEKIRNACVKAFETFQKINESDYAEIQSKLGFVIGSYDYDKNPIGLYEFGNVALPILIKIKEQGSKTVTKQLITELEKALKA